MFKILCEQYALSSQPPEATGAGDGVMVLQVACITGFPVSTPQGQQVIPLPTAVVQVAMDAAERAMMRGLLDEYDAALAAAPAGEARPEGAAWGRCGRLQEHPSHAWERPDAGEYDGIGDAPNLRMWCDGRPAHEPAQFPADDVPDPTRPDMAIDRLGDLPGPVEA